jgi:CBS-domain-containing membrane protein
MKAKDVMTGNVMSVTPDATVLQAARIMLQHHISGLPVIDKTGRLVGIVSRLRVGMQLDMGFLFCNLFWASSSRWRHTGEDLA